MGVGKEGGGGGEGMNTRRVWPRYNDPAKNIFLLATQADALSLQNFTFFSLINSVLFDHMILKWASASPCVAIFPTECEFARYANS